MPVKQLSLAKSRLAFCLGEHRAAFAKSLMLHMLDALQGADIFDQILVVTPDEHVGELARARGARVAADDGASLNTAFSLGLSTARTQAADIVVLVPADLALLRKDDMRALLEAYRAAGARAQLPGVGLVRCKDGEGTNMVFCDRETPFEPHFGPGSFMHHAAAGPFCELHNANAAFDIDTEGDMAQLLSLLHTLDATDPIALLLQDHRVRQEILQRCKITNRM